MKASLSILIAGSLWLCIHTGTFGYGSLVKGHVSDSTSGHSLAGATIVLGADQELSITDELGNFKFDDLAPGTYRVRVSYIGYRAQEIVVSVGENETVTVKVQLAASTLSLNEVVVSGNASAEETMTTISKIDMALRPVKSSQEILRMIPGVVTAQHAGGGKAEQIFLRGFDLDHGTDISLSVDGMPVNMVSHAHGQGYADLHFLTPEIIDYVNFNKGPYYASVGDFNTTGYANFQTKNALDQSSVKFEAGRFDTYRAVGLFNVLNNPTKNQHAYFATEYQFTNGPFESPQNFNRINLFGKFTSRIGDHEFFTASLSTFKSEWDASGQIPERTISSGLISRFGALDNTEGGFTGRSNANFSFLKFLDDGSFLKNQFYVSRYNFELYSNFTYFLNDSINGDEIKQKENRTIYGYNGSYQKELHLGSMPVQSEFGMGFRYDDVDNIELSHVKARYTFISPIALGDVDQINGSAYADFKVSLSSRLILNAGGRVDAFSFQYANKLDSSYSRKVQTATAISPKLSLFYNATPALQLYIKSGYGFHSNDARVVVAQEGKQILPKAFGTDIGFFAKPAKSLLVNFAIWQLNLQQEFVYVGDEAVVEPSGETQRYGLDLSLRYQALNWLFLDFDGNYAHGRSVDDPEGENYIPLAPTFTSVAGVTATLRNGLRASLRYRLVSDRPANENNSVVAKGYFLLDGVITYTRSKYELSLSATNILNREWNEAQFDTLTRLRGENTGVSELTFTPGDPAFVKTGIRFFF
ncbi:TonB-dependent receptor [Chryseolinea soli]|uniref:TonB-dependent receptor n=1 Tax=Chryseolinea soli TaxID=2321403 RepID=A0A385SE72_9BACT|nr:TonB-dependent receptor [Chryseolinea soli]AYB29993.1 TonB-dependent receptor [Chryseolinea soli]